MAEAIVGEIKFERIHRIGDKQDDAEYPRKIVAKFCNFKDRELVRKQAAQLFAGPNTRYPNSFLVK